MNHRTNGTTFDCRGCRYWSEMIAQSNGAAVEALCLSSESERSSKFMRGHETCTAWASGYDGAIDAPGTDPLRYTDDESSSDAVGYDAEESRDAYIERMAQQGLEPSFPADDELQIDIDTPEHQAVFDRAFEVLKREIDEDLTFTETPSKSGLPKKHIRITMPFELDVHERIAWQAALGSDPMRELLSLIRYLRGIANPTLLMERRTDA